MAACLWLAVAAAACAQFPSEGGTIKTKDFGDGSLDVKYFNEQSSSGTCGCLHVEVLSLTGPSPRDRNLEIVFYVDFAIGESRNGTAYRLPVLLAEGARKVELSLPYVSPGQASHPGNQALVSIWDVDVLEDGRDAENTRIYDGGPNIAPAAFAQGAGSRSNFHAASSNGLGWSMLRLIDDGVVPNSLQPEMSRLLTAASDSNVGLSASILAKTNFGLSSDWQNIGNIRKLSTAPEQWQYYLQFNLVVLDEVVFARITSQRPRVSEAIQHYVAAGGSILLLSDQQSGHELIDRWLSEPARSRDAATGRSAPGTAASSESSAKGSDWHRITAPIGNWWQHSAGSVPSASAWQQAGTFGMSSAVTPTPTVVYQSGQTVPIYGQPVPEVAKAPDPYAPQSPTQPGSAGQPFPMPNAQAAQQPQKQATTELLPLSVGGFARDLLTLGETYAMAQYGNGLVVADHLVKSVYDNNLVSSQGVPYAIGVDFGGMNSGISSSVGGTVVSAAPKPFEIATMFEPLETSLESAVADLQTSDLAGCSVRSFGLGQIGVVQSSLNVQPIESLTQLTRDLNASASMRISSMLDAAWPWRNLITSVGRPPVWTFCAFVLLFGLLLGPGLLIFTGWMGRRSLLIFLVPCVSLIATLSIAVYEILYEGFDTNIRVSSVVSIDEPSGKSFAWSRQTYFSGWPPREGLEFPSDTYFRPVIEHENEYRYELTDPQRTVGSRIAVGDDSMRWNGWLRARQQQQVLVGHPAQATAPLHATRVDSQHVKIKNQTDELLPFAVVRDEGEGYYMATDLAPGAESDCLIRTAYDVGVELTRFRAKHLPIAPPEMQANGGWGWGRRYYSYAFDATNTEMLDAAWQRYMTESLHLPRFGFVTLQADCDAVYVPLKGNVTESKHLVVGRLVW